MLSLEKLVARAGEMGWDWFGQVPEGETATSEKAKALEIERSQRLAQACARLAENTDFVTLINHLVDTTILQPVQYVALGLPIDQTALNAARREGENALVWKVLKLAHAGRTTPLPRPKEEQDR